MILSASRRTDIPALYGEWLVNRLAAGEVLIPQPYRAHHATRLLFSPETVDVLVLWSKNPAPFFTALDRVENLGYKNLVRSEERRVGKECMPQCRSRWSPYH